MDVKSSERYLNIASGVYTVDGFENYDNSYFLKLSYFYAWIKPFVPGAERRRWIERYVEVRKEKNIQVLNCRKAKAYKRFADNSIDHILCSHFLEHLYEEDALEVMKQFLRILKPGATVHIILPDMEKLVKEYLADPEDLSVDTFLVSSMLTRPTRPSLTYRIMNFSGNYGMNHLWMYDHKSAQLKMERMGFGIDNELTTPSSFFREGDDSIHMIGVKPG